MSIWRKGLYTSSGIATLMCASAAMAQATATAASDKASDQTQAASSQDIVVTGSRTAKNGNEAPTPITVLSSEQLQLAAPSGVADALAQTPQFRGSLRQSSTSSTQFPLISVVNLRSLGNLQTPRTLVLFNGRRINPASQFGQVDLNTLPNMLLKRVDVVTGGASAAYGSDAVAGVVNYILDDDFRGLKFDANSGISSRADDGSYRLGVAGGTTLLDGRLHLVGSAEHYHSDGIIGEDGRKWAQRHCEPILNPTWPQDGRSNFLLRCGVVGTDFAPGGVITTGPLRGTQFLAGGVPAPYQYGSELTPGGTMVGGDGQWLSKGAIAQSLSTTNLFAHAKLDVSDNLSIFAEGSYAESEGSQPFIPGFFAGGTAFTIFPDNPYLPASIKSQMAATGQTSIRVGRASLDWGRPEGSTKSKAWRGTLGFDYDLGGWKFSGYVDLGRTDLDQLTHNNVNRARVYEAADAVINPANGQIVCRSSLTNPNNGCSPLNIFGPGSANASALGYVLGDAFTSSWSQQLASELSVRGSPFNTWAGEVRVAAGLTYRDLSAAGTADAVSTTLVTAAPGSKGTPTSIVGVLGGWQVGNQVAQPRGSYNVKEVFGEATIPLANGQPWAYSADLNGAIRYADYSTSGGVTSWKIGLTYAPSPDIRFRATKSRDVRAPNLGELFGASALSSSSINDPVLKSTYTTANFSDSNPNLKPEFGDTKTAGVVLTPRFIPGLSVAVDWYDIRVSGAVANLSAQDFVNLCANGDAVYCAGVTRQPGTNIITQIHRPFQNLGALRAQGVDIEANYRLDLNRLSAKMAGSLGIRALVSYLGHLKTIDASGNVVEHAGVNGGESVATPKWQGTVAVTYDTGPWTFFVQERFISGGLQNTGGGTSSLGTPYASGTGPNSLDSTHIPAIQYTDLTIQRRIGERFQIYATINNLFDKDPPEAPTRAGVPITTLDTNGTLYDVVGRYMTVGVRLRY